MIAAPEPLAVDAGAAVVDVDELLFEALLLVALLAPPSLAHPATNTAAPRPPSRPRNSTTEVRLAGKAGADDVAAFAAPFLSAWVGPSIASS